MNRSRIALMNMFASLVNKLIAIAFALVLPRIMIVNLGSEANGLISSITSMFVYINLLEAGVGGASTFALYSSIVKNDRKKINGILSATNSYYKKIGVYFFGCISALAFLYPLIVNSDIPYTTICAVVFLTAIPSILNYFLQGKYIILLAADNRGYITTNTITIFTIILNVIKIILLIEGFNIIFIQITFAIVSSLQALFIFYYIKGKYPWVDLSVVPDFEAVSQKNSVMIHQISGVLFSNTSMLLLTLFTDLKTVSVYTVYLMIFTQVYTIPQFISDAVTASFGQIYNENLERFKSIFSSFETYYLQIVYASMATALLLTLPFIKLYTAGVTDANYIDHLLPILFTVAYVLLCVEIPYILLIRISGHFKQTQVHAVLEAIINVVVSLALVFSIGVYGVLIGMIISVLFRCIVTIRYCYKNILQRSIWKISVDFLLSVASCILVAILFNEQISAVDSYFSFFKIAIFMFPTLMLILMGKTLLFGKEDSQVLQSFAKRLVNFN